MKTRRFAVIGDPVTHSRSPAMHTAAFRALGLPHVYEAIRVTVADLPRLVQDMRQGAYDGLNVTVPHKRAVLSLVDDVHDTARDVGAANTVAWKDGRLVAYNTDTTALALELRSLTDREDWTPGRALVLGHGGAARAAAFALAHDLGCRDVVVRSRSSEALLGHVGQPWRPDATSESRTRTVVQATSAGMHGADPGELAAGAVAWDCLPADAVALDVVYAPTDTPFSRAARARGLSSATGLGMLARQGALAFGIWLGVPAPYEIMRAALEPGA